ncbi:MAG: class I SAM-dependent methyltransferase [Thermoanaerobaculia bacterium]|nr:class I SAM-dependent methyltransferase [Thermoanaerobaculia bacterium]
MSGRFEVCAGDYDAFRPEYPPALWDWIAHRFGLPPGAEVLDVGAGSGRASVPLAERGYRVIALEPSETMRAHGLQRAAAFGDRLEFVGGAAEETRRPAGSADLVVCAQAFHWVDPARALPEFARVLRPGGGLAIFWNDREREHGTVAAELEALVSRYNPAYCCEYRDRDWAEILAVSGRFSPAERQVFRHGVTMDADSLIGLTRSFSYVRNVLDETHRGAFEQEVRDLVRALHGDEPFTLGYRTELYAAQRGVW